MQHPARSSQKANHALWSKMGSPQLCDSDLGCISHRREPAGVKNRCCHFILWSSSFTLKLCSKVTLSRLLVVVSQCKQTVRFRPVMVSWKLLLFWAVRPKWAVTKRLFIAEPLISCHDGSETNTQCHCMGETSFWTDFKLWCITESNSLPSSEWIAVGAHPPCWRIRTEGYFWSCGKANPTLRAAAGMSDCSAPHLWDCDFPQPKGHTMTTSLGK